MNTTILYLVFAIAVSVDATRSTHPPNAKKNGSPQDRCIGVSSSDVVQNCTYHWPAYVAVNFTCRSSSTEMDAPRDKGKSRAKGKARNVANGYVKTRLMKTILRCGPQIKNEFPALNKTNKCESESSRCLICTLHKIDEKIEKFAALLAKDCSKRVWERPKRVRQHEEVTGNSKGMKFIHRHGHRKPPVDLLANSTYARLMPRSWLKNLTIADINLKSPNLFNNLPIAKKLALTQQTLDKLDIVRQKSLIRRTFVRKQCGFVNSIGESTLAQTGIMDIDIAMEMCNCGNEYIADIPAKLEKICESIYENLGTFKAFETFMSDGAGICTACFVYVMTRRPSWEDKVKASPFLKRVACDKIGSSVLLPSAVLSKWAALCILPSGGQGCSATRPSFMVFRSTLPSPTDLASCASFFCKRLCKLTTEEISTIIKALVAKPATGDLGCLAFLDDDIMIQSDSLTPVNTSDINGRCTRKSNVIKRSLDASGRRKKRSCSLTCNTITLYSDMGVQPTDLLSPKIIYDGCLSGKDMFTCVQTEWLGAMDWNTEQANQLYKLIKQHMDVTAVPNWTSGDISSMGFIGLAFTPEELGTTLRNINNDVYNAFGAVYGWAPDQLKALASRYLRDNGLQLADLTPEDLARLNHILCGFTREEIKQINYEAIRFAAPVLGKMKRCQIGVLTELTRKLKLAHGPSKSWKEADLSEFGIILAGLDGKELEHFGIALADHATVPFVTHIPPKEIGELSPSQTKLFQYHVALAASDRGLCPWLYPKQKLGHFMTMCSVANGVPAVSPIVFFMVLLAFIG